MKDSDGAEDHDAGGHGSGYPRGRSMHHEGQRHDMADQHNEQHHHNNDHRRHHDDDGDDH